MTHSPHGWAHGPLVHNGPACSGEGGGGARSTPSHTARAGKHRFRPLSALRAHTKPPYSTDSLWETLTALDRPGRTVWKAARGSKPRPFRVAVVTSSVTPSHGRVCHFDARH
jgi:hypothetical protein